MVSEWTPAQRRAAAADLCERAAAVLRTGRAFARVVMVQARCLEQPLSSPDGDAEADYRSGLEECGVACHDADAAVAAILAGQHPPDSLAARLFSARTLYQEAAATHRRNHDRASAVSFQEGRASALLTVLQWIGLAPTPTKETP